METDPTNDIDDLFKQSDSYRKVQDSAINILLVGQYKTYKKFERKLDPSEYKIVHVTSIDDSIGLLLVDIFGIVFIDNDDPKIDPITVSRVVRINHPLARIIIVSKRRGSSLIADIVNHGSADAFITLPINVSEINNLIQEQYAKHEISIMLTSFVSQPPKLSKASYLLLDPSLSFSDESEPVKFVGIMIAYNSVPRFSMFFEELLAKDHLLFAGYLSGVAILGRELFTNKKPLKEINFGGVSVILRFHGDVQFSIFVRNLTRYNFSSTEEIISDLVSKILDCCREEIEDMDIISEDAHQKLMLLSKKLESINEFVLFEQETADQIFDEQVILMIGSDKKFLSKIKNFMERRRNLQVITTKNVDDIISYINQHNCGALLLDSELKDGNPLNLAEYAKEINPAIQVIYRIRDRRASSPLIRALNSGVINYIIPYKAPFKELTKWTLNSLEKSREIKEKSISGENIAQALDQATIARMMIRKNLERFEPESKPELRGIFISKAVEPIFQIFWGRDDDEKIEFDEEMMAGLVSSLGDVGEEMFSEQETIGKLELGGADILVQHRDDFTFAFIIKNIDPNTSVVINKEIIKSADSLFIIVKDGIDRSNANEIQSRFDTTSNIIYSQFTEKFLE